MHPLFSTHEYGKNINKYRIEEPPTSRRELISKKVEVVTRGGPDDFSDIGAIAAETNIVAMRVEAQVPQKIVGHGY